MPSSETEDDSGGHLYPIKDLSHWHQPQNTRPLLQLQEPLSKEHLSEITKKNGNSNRKNNNPANCISEESILGQIEDMNDDSSKSGWPGRTGRRGRWYLCVSIVIYGMIFNGSAFGFTSPALLTLQRHSDSTEGADNVTVEGGGGEDDDYSYYLVSGRRL